MAKQDQGIIGGFRGTIGPVIGYQWRGRWCLRSRPRRVSNPRTEAQQEHRMVFREMVRTAGRLNGALRYGLRQASMEMGMTEGNLFVKMNKGCFSAQGIDYAGLQLSLGPVAPVGFGAARVDERGVMHVEFEKNPLRMQAAGDDEVHVVLYCPKLQRTLQAAPVQRRTRRVSVALPDEWAGLEVHAYGFVADYRQRASETAYIPLGTAPDAASTPVAASTAATTATGGTTDNPSANTTTEDETHSDTCRPRPMGHDDPWPALE